MIKFPHLLRDNKSSKIPHRFIFFDTETKRVEVSQKEFEHRLRLGVACYCRFSNDKGIITEDWLYFKKKEDFWKWVESKVYKKERLVLISHNIQFDFKVLSGFKFLKDLGYKPTKIILNDDSNIWLVRKKQKSILVLDSLNYFRVSIGVLGKSLNLPKLKMPEPEESDEVWFEYCKRDVEILKETWFGWLRFIRENDLGSFGLTLPSQAFNCFRHKFLKYKIFIHNRKSITELERESYHGGRNEVFRFGKFSGQNFYLFDVNSMYPYVMREFEYPTKLVWSYPKLSIERLKRVLEKFCVISRVLLKTDQPVFAVKMKSHLVFPIGEFEVVLTTEELKEALRLNAIKEVYETAIYQKAPIFRDYVNYFYNLRKKFKEEGNEFFEWLCKLFLNSLYGKFGQMNEVFKFVGYDPETDDKVEIIFDDEDQTTRIRRTIMGRIEISMGKVEAFNSFPAISSEVTANARLYLWKLIERAGKENVYYCDTDSLIVNKEGAKRLLNLVSPNELGYLKCEKKGSYLEIRGLKDYTFDDIVKIKGVKKDSQKISEGLYLQTQFEKVKSSLHNQRLNILIEKKVVKKLKREYKKGIVDDKGYVHPFNFPLEGTEITLREIDQLFRG